MSPRLCLFISSDAIFKGDASNWFITKHILKLPSLLS